MIITLLSRKGGVGKTTTSVSLAAAFARRGYRVLLVDLDSQASASLSAGLNRRQLVPSAADILLGDTPAREAIHSSSTPNLDVIPASTDLISADVDLGALRRKEHRLAGRLEPIRNDYDMIFVDCPPSLSLLPINALVACDHFIVPVPPQFLATEGVTNLLAAAKRVGARTGRRPRLLGLLMTMADYRLKATRDQVDALREKFGSDVFAVEIRINVRLSEAPEAGLSIFDYAPDSSGAQAYDLLADEVLMRLAPWQPTLALEGVATGESTP